MSVNVTLPKSVVPVDEFVRAEKIRDIEGVERFALSRTSLQNSGVSTTAVVYAVGTPKTEVVREFLRLNEQILEEKGRIGAVTEMFGDMGNAWAEAWKEVEPEFDHDLVNSGKITSPNGVTCPCCGEVFDYLPRHLPCDG